MPGLTTLGGDRDIVHADFTFLWSPTLSVWVAQWQAELANGHRYYANIQVPGFEPKPWDMIEDFRQRCRSRLYEIIAEGEEEQG